MPAWIIALYAMSIGATFTVFWWMEVLDGIKDNWKKLVAVTVIAPVFLVVIVVCWVLDMCRGLKPKIREK